MDTMVHSFSSKDPCCRPCPPFEEHKLPPAGMPTGSGETVAETLNWKKPICVNPCDRCKSVASKVVRISFLHTSHGPPSSEQPFWLNLIIAPPLGVDIHPPPPTPSNLGFDFRVRGRLGDSKSSDHQYGSHVLFLGNN